MTTAVWSSSAQSLRDCLFIDELREVADKQPYAGLLTELGGQTQVFNKEFDGEGRIEIAFQNEVRHCAVQHAAVAHGGPKHLVRHFGVHPILDPQHHCFRNARQIDAHEQLVLELYH